VLARIPAWLTRLELHLGFSPVEVGRRDRHRESYAAGLRICLPLNPVFCNRADTGSAAAIKGDAG
jgi:hypothetical protein